MKLKHVSVIVLLTAFLLLCTWYEASRPEPTDWSVTYSPQDKIPFGTYIVYNSLGDLFPGSEVRLSRLSLVEMMERPAFREAGTYIYVGGIFEADSLEVAALLGWVEQGNRLFVAANHFSDSFLDRFSIGETGVLRRGHAHLAFGGFEEKAYVFKSPVSWFVPDSSFTGQRLGWVIADTCPDFVSMPYGKGRVWLNLHPQAYTNYEVLDSLNGDYAFKTLSCLPVDSRPLVWDAYVSMGREGGDSPLRVILGYPGLRLALYLLLLSALCYVFCRAKREQRPIPVVRPPENRMLAFVGTVSALYYRQKGHAAMARKQADFFLGEVRERYHLPTDRLDEGFARLLSERSGVGFQETKGLVELLAGLDERTDVTPEELGRLMAATDVFVGKMYDNESVNRLII